LVIRTQIKKLLLEFPKPQKFHVNKIVAKTMADKAYLSYAMLSMDAHPSATSLQRHLEWEKENETVYLTLNICPPLSVAERLIIVHEACVALLGVCVAVNQLLGGTTKSDTLREIFERFEYRSPAL
jgi:hypothetical protein